KATSFLRINTKGTSFSRQGVTLLPRLEYSGEITAHCSLNLQSSSNLLISASQVAGTTGARHHSWLIFVLFVETVSSCCSGWSQIPRLKPSTCLRLPKGWDYRGEPLDSALIPI
uniref:Uncharacterized protein n=1 Tax=Callithrix jacchus TaxID=9483 RepID=A0A8I4A1D1_CALJA